MRNLQDEVSEDGVAKETIPDKLFFKIGEVADLARTRPHVLRYWESEFKVLKPVKNASAQRVYRRKDVELVLEIKRLLYEEQYTISGAKKKLSTRRSSTKADEPHQGKGARPRGADRTRLDKLLKEIEENLSSLLNHMGPPP